MATPAANITQGINGSGGIVGAAYLANVQAANSDGVKAIVSAATSSNAIMLALQAGVTAWGAYKQYDMYEKQGELALANKAWIEKYAALYEDQYNTISKPRFLKAEDKHYGYAWGWGKPLWESIVKCGVKNCEYIQDNGAYSKSAANITPIITKLKQNLQRSVKKYQCGKWADMSYRIEAINAQLRVEAHSLAYNYMDKVKIAWEQFYWAKQTTSLQHVGNMLSMTGNVMTGAGSNMGSVLQGMSGVGELLGKNLQAQFGALSNQAQVFTGVGAFMGSMAGQQYGQQMGGALISSMNLPNSRYGMQSPNVAMGGMSIDQNMSQGITANQILGGVKNSEYSPLYDADANYIDNRGIL